MTAGRLDPEDRGDGEEVRADATVDG